MRSLSVFCASSPGRIPIYGHAARAAGSELAKRGMRVVYGGSKVGLMGEVADGALEQGGEVIGVLPRFMQVREIAHDGLSRLIYVESMQERKLKMHELSDGVLALPGGFGTLEELFEMLTWSQLGLHKKPIGILNTAGYYDHFARMIDHMEAEELLASKNARLILIDSDLDTLLDKMEAFEPGIGSVGMQEKHT